MGRKAIDLTGQRFGMMTVLGVDQAAVRGQHISVRWMIRCDCGKRKSVSGHVLRVLGQKSCGCQRGGSGRFQSKYGVPSHVAKHWASMMSRCYRPKTAKEARLYKERGIVVCPEWHDPRKFYEDMGERPSPGLSLDRIDNDGPYSKENCRWATASQQNRNRRPFKIRRRSLAHPAHTIS